MKTEDLIADLASRATPVKPLPAPGVRLLFWLGIAAASAAAGVLVFGARQDLGSRLSDGRFLWTGALAVFASGIGALAALVLAIPAAERSPRLRRIWAGAIGVWAGTLVIVLFNEGLGLTGVSDWYVCFLRVMAVGLVPGVALVVMLRRAAPLEPGRTAALALPAAAAIGALSVQLVCPVDDAAHALLGHLGPMLAFVAVGFAAGGALLSVSSTAATRR